MADEKKTADEKKDEFALTDEDRAEKKALEAKHGGVHLITCEGLRAWFKEPSIDEVDLFITDMLDTRTRGSATLDLMRRNIVSPTTDAKAFFAKRPGLSWPFAQAYTKATGVLADALLGK
jgi:hypothetical protein